MCIYVYIYIYIYVYICIICVYIYIIININIYLYIYRYVYVYIFICIHTCFACRVQACPLYAELARLSEDIVVKHVLNCDVKRRSRPAVR